MEYRYGLYKDWLGAYEAIGIPAISHHAAARILAVTYVHGNNEALVMNKKYLAEVEHIKKMYHVDGGESPDDELVELIQQYVKELEQYRDDHDNDSTGEAIFRSHAPEWAHRLLMDRYGIKIIN